MGHTPRLSPRPTPLSTSHVLFKMVEEGLRIPLVISAFCYLMAPCYFYAAEWWLAKGWSECAFLVVGSSLLHTIVYLVLCGFFHLCDKYDYL
jgi:hypothetical protein